MTFKALLPSCLLACLAASPALADWEPEGPIRLLIGFGAGGGTDAQARALAEDISAGHGWEIIPQNVPGAGGAVMAAQLKDEPADGLTIGFALNTTFTFPTPSNDGFGLEDFTFLTSTAASQTGVIVRADSPWTSMHDLVEAAQSGTRVVWTNYDPLTQLASEVIADHFGIEVNHVTGSGGRSGVDSLVAMDANVAWAGGAQQALVEADELRILASAEAEPLAQALDGETLADLGIPYTFGFKFVLLTPADLSDVARETITNVVTEILADSESRTSQFIARQYPPAPAVVSGSELDGELARDLEAFRSLQSQFQQQ